MVKCLRNNDGTGPYYMLIACLLIFSFIYLFLISLFKNKMRGPEGGPERGLKGAPEGTNTK